MSLRAYLQKLQDQKNITVVNAPISKTYEISGVLKQLEPRPVFFERVKESPFRVMGNLFCSKAAFADYFGISAEEIIPLLVQAAEQPSLPEVVVNAPCQEVVELEPDLDHLPILRHCEQDGGNYISAGVVITRHPI